MTKYFYVTFQSTCICTFMGCNVLRMKDEFNFTQFFEYSMGFGHGPCILLMIHEVNDKQAQQFWDSCAKMELRNRNFTLIDGGK